MSMASYQMSHVGTASSMMAKVDEYIKVSMENVIDTLEDVSNFVDKENSEPYFARLRESMTKFVALDRQLSSNLQALNHVQTMVTERKREEQRSNQDDDSLPDLKLVESYAQKVVELKEEASKTPMTEHAKFKELNQKIGQCYNNDDDDDDDIPTQEEEMIDDDIGISQADIVTKCPLTKKEMVDPVQNVHCKHNYDREGIMAHIKARGNRAKCPIGGCANSRPVDASHLMDNTELKKIIEKLSKKKGNKTSKKPKKL